MRILVIGCGSIGRRHIRLLREMGVEMDGYDSEPAAQERATAELGVTVHSDIADALDAEPIGVISARPCRRRWQCTR